MQSTLGIKNIVLLGIFDTSIFDRYFFIKNDIIKSDDEILPTSTFNSTGLIQLVTSKFHIIITSNQAVISALEPEKNVDEINVITSTLVSKANLSNITAMGINFHWFLLDASKSIEKFSKEYFYNDKIEVFAKFFNTEDSKFGAYASKNFKEARLKVDIKPSKISENFVPSSTIFNPDDEFMSFSFNYHFDIKGSNVNAQALKYINDYQEYSNESKRIISTYLPTK